MLAEAFSEILWAAVLLPVVGIAGLAGIVWFIGFASGWRDLARAFPGRPSSAEVRRTSGSISIDGVNFAPVGIGLSREGVHLESLFQFGATTVFLPWSELHERFEEEHGFKPWKPRVSFAVGTPRRWRLALPGSLFVPPKVPAPPEQNASAPGQNPGSSPDA